MSQKNCPDHPTGVGVGVSAALLGQGCEAVQLWFDGAVACRYEKTVWICQSGIYFGFYVVVLEKGCIHKAAGQVCSVPWERHVRKSQWHDSYVARMWAIAMTQTLLIIFVKGPVVIRSPIPISEP